MLHAKPDKIQKALQLLNAAAQEKRAEVYEVFGNKYEHLKEVFENGHEMAEHAKKQLAKELQQKGKKIKEAAAHMNKKIHDQPWAYVGGLALGSLILGLLWGRRK